VIDRDGIKWEAVQSMLYYTFRNSELEITIVTREQLSKEDQLQIIRKFHETPLGGTSKNKSDIPKNTTATSLERNETDDQNIYPFL